MKAFQTSKSQANVQKIFQQENVKKQYLRTRIQIKNNLKNNLNLIAQTPPNPLSLQSYLNMFPEHKKKYNNSLFNFLHSKFGQKTKQKFQKLDKQQKDSQRKNHPDFIVKKKNYKQPFYSLSAQKIQLRQSKNSTTSVRQKPVAQQKEVYNHRQKQKKHIIRFYHSQKKVSQTNQQVKQNQQQQTNNQKSFLLKNQFLSHNQSIINHYEYTTDATTSSLSPQKLLSAKNANDSKTIAQLMQKNNKFDRKKYMYYRYRKKYSQKRNIQTSNNQEQQIQYQCSHSQLKTRQQKRCKFIGIKRKNNSNNNDINSSHNNKRLFTKTTNSLKTDIILNSHEKSQQQEDQNTMKSLYDQKNNTSTKRNLLLEKHHSNNQLCPNHHYYFCTSPNKQKQNSLLGVVIMSNKSILNLKPKIIGTPLNRRNSQKTAEIDNRKSLSRTARQGYRREQKSGSKFFDQAIHFKRNKQKYDQNQTTIEALRNDGPIKGWNSKDHGAQQLEQFQNETQFH